jgi:hypothetical protein
LEDAIETSEDKDKSKDSKENQSAYKKVKLDHDGDDYLGYYEREQQTILCDIDEMQKKQNEACSLLVPSLDLLMERLPEGVSVCFLLTHQYPMAFDAKDLRASDRVLYDLLSTHYEVDIGYAVNLLVGSFPETTFRDPQSLCVMTYNTKQAFLKYIEGEMTDEEYEKLKAEPRMGALVFAGCGCRSNWDWTKEKV